MYEQAAAAGDPYAPYRLAQLVEESDPQAGRASYEQAAPAGNRYATFRLGLLLMYTDPQAAREWFERAAAAGYTEAMNYLGVLLSDSDPQAAREWFERAAAAGYTNADRWRRGSELAFSPATDLGSVIASARTAARIDGSSRSCSPTCRPSPGPPSGSTLAPWLASSGAQDGRRRRVSRRPALDGFPGLIEAAREVAALDPPHAVDDERGNRPRLADLHETFANGPKGGLGARGETELAQDVRHVRTSRPLADRQLGGDFLIGLPGS